MGTWKVAVMHCWGHQKENTPQTWGNWLADKATKNSAEKFGATGREVYQNLCTLKNAWVNFVPQYTPSQDQLAEAERAKGKCCPEMKQKPPGIPLKGTLSGL